MNLKIHEGYEGFNFNEDKMWKVHWIPSHSNLISGFIPENSWVIETSRTNSGAKPLEVCVFVDEGVGRGWKGLDCWYNDYNDKLNAQVRENQ